MTKMSIWPWSLMTCDYVDLWLFMMRLIETKLVDRLICIEIWQNVDLTLTLSDLWWPWPFFVCGSLDKYNDICLNRYDLYSVKYGQKCRPWPWVTLTINHFVQIIEPKLMAIVWSQYEQYLMARVVVHLYRI